MTEGVKLIGVKVSTKIASVGDGEGSMTAEVGVGGVGVAAGDSANNTSVGEVVGLGVGVGPRDKMGWQPTNATNRNKANRLSPTPARRNPTLSTQEYPLDSSAMTIRPPREVNWRSLT